MGGESREPRHPHEWNPVLAMVNAESILRRLAEPVLVLDESLRAVFANPAFYETLQLEPGDLEGKSVEDVFVGENGRPRLQTALEAALGDDSNAERIEVEYVIPPDTRKVLSMSARPLTSDENQAKLILVELREITAEKETEHQLQDLYDALSRRTGDLEQINADLESFTRWVSHDLRTPLRFISTVVHRLMEEHGPELPVGARESVHMIADCAREMGRLTENLLAFAHVDRAPIQKRQIDLSRLAREALTDLKADQQGRCVDVVIDELPPGHADRTLMKQVFINLLANALKFTQSREHGRIHVGFVQLDGGGVYFVRDNGVGLEAEQASSIFSPIQGSHSAQPQQGTGVGLTLVKRIIERHGGHIWAESEPSKGATFYFQLGE